MPCNNGGLSRSGRPPVGLQPGKSQPVWTQLNLKIHIKYSRRLSPTTLFLLEKPLPKGKENFHAPTPLAPPQPIPPKKNEEFSLATVVAHPNDQLNFLQGSAAVVAEAQSPTLSTVEQSDQVRQPLQLGQAGQRKVRVSHIQAAQARHPQQALHLLLGSLATLEITHGTVLSSTPTGSRSHRGDKTTAPSFAVCAKQ